MLRKMLILTVFLLLIPGSLHAQDYDLDALLNTYVADDDPGVVIFISDGEETATAVRGLADLDAGTPMTTTDRFRIASMTKPFVATLMLQLQEEGLLSLDDLISKYLPAEVISGIENADQMTIRQLLNMTSGIFNYTESDGYYAMLENEPDHIWSAAETVELAYGVEGYFPPGEGYYYSNTNYNLAEMIIAGVTNSTLAEQLSTRIFKPLNMNDTVLEDPTKIGEGIIHGYSDWDGDGALDDVTLLNDAVGLADGGIISTAADLDLFLRGLFGGDLISEASLAAMMDWVDDGEGGLYGLGLVDYSAEDTESYGHSGASAGFQSDMTYFPEEEISVIVLTNNFDTEVLGSIATDAYWLVLEGEE